MKKLASGIVAIALSAIATIAPARASTYNLTFHGDVFDVDATLSTDALDNVLTISGTVAGPNGYSTTIANLVPTTTSLYHDLWLWNNLFDDSEPHVDWYGLLWQNTDGSIANYYLANGNFILSMANPNTGNYSYWANGDVGLQSVAAVPVPAAIWFLGSSLLGLAFLGRRRSSLQTQ